MRLFIGSGCRAGCGAASSARFSPARVLEFYAATEAGAILINVSGSKPGAMGRPLPGSAEVRIAGLRHRRARAGRSRADGFVRECGDDEVGMLLARVGRGDSRPHAPLRGVFARDDAWVATGDLFRRDGDGDYWRMDSVARRRSAPRTGRCTRSRSGTPSATLPAVDLAVAYGVAPDGAGSRSRWPR